MTFKVGETVVYPHHGAALIEAIEKRVIKGEEKTYLVLKIAQGDLTVRVPAENVDLVGVRDVVDSAGLDRVFNVLRQPYTEEPTNWSRRYKANLEKLASGDVIKYASAYVVLPGGFGTLDELMEVITLIQTGKSRKIPIILVGKDFWSGLLGWLKDKIVNEGMAELKDLDLIQILEEPKEIVDAIFNHYESIGFTLTPAERKAQLYL